MKDIDKFPKKIVIINPTYNERENISILIDKIARLKGKLQPYTLLQLIVDDNSPDGTARVVKEKQKKYDHIYLIHGKKQGLGEAYKRGMIYATKKLHADIIVMMDADLQHNPSILPSMLKKIEQGYDLVIGSRYIKGGSYPEEWGRFRVFNSKAANFLARYIAGIYDIKDCTSGYRVIRVKNLLDKRIKDIHAIGYSFQLSLLSTVLKAGAKGIEYPITFNERKFGKSKVGANKYYIRDIFEFFKIAFLIRFYKIKDNSPH